MGAQMTPDWARAKLTEAIEKEELGEQPLSLNQLGIVFLALLAEKAPGSKRPGIFATLGGHSDSQNTSPQAALDQSNTKCPCQAKSSK